MMKPGAKRALLITIVYLVAGMCWIAFSDNLIQGFTSDSDLLTKIQTIKGWLYVFVTAVLLYFMILWSQRQIQTIAQTDALTGLPNRQALDSTLSERTARADKEQNAFALIIVDIDNFGEINHLLGYEQGDTILRAVARHLVNTLPHSSRCYRFGGDEFVLLYPYGDLQEVHRLITALHQAFDLSQQTLSFDIELTTSVGLALYPSDASDASSLENNADLALHHAKLMGRNQDCYYQQTYTQNIREKNELLKALRSAISNNEIHIHFQPQINTVTLETIGVEALARWQHPESGPISPDVFIPIAESSGLIHEMTLYMIRKSVEELTEHNLFGNPVQTLSINLSASTFSSPHWIAAIGDYIREIPELAQYIQFEITESAVMDDIQRSMHFLKFFQELNIRFSIDDFGTGHSSLASLKKLPLNELKIDKTFIDDVPGHEDDETITRTIIAMASTLKLNIIAEGVENRQQVDFLKENGCPAIQGYYFARPMPLTELRQQLLAS